MLSLNYGTSCFSFKDASCKGWVKLSYWFLMRRKKLVKFSHDAHPHDDQNLTRVTIKNLSRCTRNILGEFVLLKLVLVLIQFINYSFVTKLVMNWFKTRTTKPFPRVVYSFYMKYAESQLFSHSIVYNIYR